MLAFTDDDEYDPEPIHQKKSVVYVVGCWLNTSCHGQYMVTNLWLKRIMSLFSTYRGVVHHGIVSFSTKIYLRMVLLSIWYLSI